MKKGLSIILAALCLILAGCAEDRTNPIPGIKPEDRGPDIEPTATYDWMAGESPVPTKRMGVVRYGVNYLDHAVSPTGVYYVHERFIYYADNGSDTFVKLCGRVDCTHDNKDCNAFVSGAMNISYYGGYLYLTSADPEENKAVLLRMDPDGSDHVEVLDLLGFAKDNGGDFVLCNMITDGFCVFSPMKRITTQNGTNTSITAKSLDYYIYKIDGSMGEPVKDKCFGVLYHCGDVLRAMSNETRNGGEYGSIWAADLETGTMTYLLDHTGYTGYYDMEAGYYFKEGNIIRLDYATMEEEILVQTGLKERYLLFMFPDCMVLASRDEENPDPNLYFYNWNYELVDTVKLDYSFTGCTDFMLLAETAERIILTDSDKTKDAIPRYYINKSELGTGNVQIHKFKYA